MTKASEALKVLIKGQRIELWFEKGQEKRDSFGRLLVNVEEEVRASFHRPGYYINSRMIYLGWSPFYPKYLRSGDWRYEEFRKAEKDAKDNKRGIWAEE